MKYEKNVGIQSSSFQKDLQIMFHTVSDKRYIFRFNSKKYDLNSKIPFFTQNMWDTKKTFRWKIVWLNKVYTFLLRNFSTGCIFFPNIISNSMVADPTHWVFCSITITYKLSYDQSWPLDVAVILMLTWLLTLRSREWWTFISYYYVMLCHLKLPSHESTKLRRI